MSSITEAAGSGAKPLRLLKWRPYQNPTGPVLGLLDIELPSGLRIIDLRFGVGPRGSAYIMPPAERWRDRDDRVMLDDRGKPRWRAFIDFRSAAVRERFQDQVLDALRRDHPELFGGCGENGR